MPHIDLYSLLVGMLIGGVLTGTLQLLDVIVIKPLARQLADRLYGQRD